jgi:hypothetical protein
MFHDVKIWRVWAYSNVLFIWKKTLTYFPGVYFLSKLQELDDMNGDS